MQVTELKETLERHCLWLNSLGGERVNLSGANLSDANLRYSNLRYANLRYANLRYADLSGANLSGVDLRYANLRYANLRYANLSGADLRYVDLLCLGNMREIKTLQLDKWAVGYTVTTLQIGCQRHAIDKWRKWDTEAGHKWISQMNTQALDWAKRNLSLVLQIIDANPATPTGHEEQ